MQIFLPFSSISKSVKSLDYRRLGKQRVEALQVYTAIHNRNYGWQNHPIVNMYRNYPDFIAHYHNMCISEWILRGYHNNMDLIKYNKKYEVPKWIGDEKFHKSHRLMLLKKTLEKDSWYFDIFYNDKNDITDIRNAEYYWPIKEKKYEYLFIN